MNVNSISESHDYFSSPIQENQNLVIAKQVLKEVREAIKGIEEFYSDSNIVINFPSYIEVNGEVFRYKQLRDGSNLGNS